MRDAPSLRNVIIEFFRKLFGCFSGNGISPGSERNQKFPVFIKCKISVHHGGNSDSGKFLYNNAVFI